jgi:hypothetical protein
LHSEEKVVACRQCYLCGVSSVLQNNPFNCKNNPVVHKLRNESKWQILKVIVKKIRGQKDNDYIVLVIT